MSGHSKWATIKHQKGAKDKARGKLFAKLIRQVEVAAREGGGDLEANATLRTMYNKARAASVPIDTIERAIKRGTGELEGVTYESITYEGYAPGGVALLIDVLTDNRNRTGAEVRSVFSRLGGSMAEPGAVSWQFSRKGVVLVPRSVSEDDVMLVALDAGVEDIVDEGDAWRLTSEPQATEAVREALEAAGIEVLSAETHDDLLHHHRGHRRRGGQEGAADHGRAGGPRRRPGRLRQLRHPRRHPAGGLTMSVGVGDQAPDFTLPGTGSRTYSLDDYRGKPVVVVFYPGDDTPVCTKQLNAYSDDIGSFSDVGAQVLAISPQSVESHERFAGKHGFSFPLLADTDKAVAGRYGTLGPLGFPRRSVFVVDGEGIIRYAHRAIAGLTFRPTDELVRAVRAAQVG